MPKQNSTGVSELGLVEMTRKGRWKISDRPCVNLVGPVRGEAVWVKKPQDGLLRGIFREILRADRAYVHNVHSISRQFGCWALHDEEGAAGSGIRSFYW